MRAGTLASAIGMLVLSVGFAFWPADGLLTRHVAGLGPGYSTLLALAGGTGAIVLSQLGRDRAPRARS